MKVGDIGLEEGGCLERRGEQRRGEARRGRITNKARAAERETEVEKAKGV